MDLSVKTVVNSILAFMLIILISSIVTFSISFNNATTALYQTIQQVEIYDYDAERINAIAQNKDVHISVERINDNKQYKVTVYFEHLFSFVELKKEMKISALTRVLE